MNAAPRSESLLVVGLVVSLPPTHAEREQVMDALRGCHGVRLGVREAHLLPLSVETDDPRGFHSWLEGLPGVRAVDVVFVEVSESAAMAAAAGPRRRRHRPEGDDSDFILESNEPVFS